MFTTKVFIGAILCVVLFARIGAQGPDFERLKQDIADCAKDKQVDRTDIDNLDKIKTPETQNGKCALACAFQKNGIIKDNKFVPDNMPFGKGKDCISTIASNSDNCALAAAISDCVTK